MKCKGKNISYHTKLHNLPLPKPLPQTEIVQSYLSNRNKTEQDCKAQSTVEAVVSVILFWLLAFLLCRIYLTAGEPGCDAAISERGLTLASLHSNTFSQIELCFPSTLVCLHPNSSYNVESQNTV